MTCSKLILIVAQIICFGETSFGKEELYSPFPHITTQRLKDLRNNPGQFPAVALLDTSYTHGSGTYSEFVCVSSYPTIWKFEEAPLNEIRNNKLFITKRRIIKNVTIGSSLLSGSTIFQSNLRLNYDFPMNRYIYCTKLGNLSYSTSIFFSLKPFKLTFDEHPELPHPRQSLPNNKRLLSVSEWDTGESYEYIDDEDDDTIETFCSFNTSIFLPCSNPGNKTNEEFPICGSTKSIMIHTCSNPDECDLIKLDDRNTETRYSCPNAFKGFCIYKPREPPPYSLAWVNHGVVNCKPPEESRVDTNMNRYFMSLPIKNKGLVYRLASNLVVEEETISLKLKEASNFPNVFAGDRLIFICEAIEAYYTFGFQWSVSYNGEIHFRGEGETVLEDQIYKATKGIYVNKTYTNQFTVGCHAPKWNSYEWLNTTTDIFVAEPIPPKVKSLGGMYSTDSNHTDFLVVCNVTGLPLPKIRWIMKVIDVTHYDSDWQFENISNRFTVEHKNFKDFVVSKLLVRRIGSDDTLFICDASNFVSSTNATFFKTDGKNQDRQGTRLLTLLLIPSVILLFMLIPVVFLCRRVMQQRNIIRNLTDPEVEEFFHGNPAIVDSNIKDPQHLELLPYNMEYEIDMDDIEFDTSVVLGSGAFANVVRGRIKIMNEYVAVKIARPSTDVELFKSVLVEVKIMIYMGKHENLVSLIGVNTRNIRTRSINIVLELCELGSLDVLLRKSKPTFLNLIDGNQEINIGLNHDGESDISTLDLLRWSGEIASGMEYLEYKGIVHADLASRNILITAEKTAKVSDFGLSRKLYESSNYVKKTKCHLPWRWMAIESLNSLTFSSKSDVWSYGITLWEMFTLGDVPYPNEAWNLEFAGKIEEGLRPKKPKFSNSQIYFQLISCWELEPALRPDFSKLRKYFKELFQKHNRAFQDSFYGDMNPVESFKHTKWLTVCDNTQEHIVYSNIDVEHGQEPNYMNV